MTFPKALMKSTKHFPSIFRALGLWLWLGSCAAPPPSPPTVQEQTTFFVTKVKPVMEYYCIECHTIKSGGKYGGLILENGTLAMITGRHAPVIRPGKPENSLLLTVLRLGHEDVLGMPPAPDKIPDEAQDDVREWIRRGAYWPPGKEGHLELPKD